MVHGWPCRPPHLHPQVLPLLAGPLGASAGSLLLHLATSSMDLGEAPQPRPGDHPTLPLLLTLLTLLLLTYPLSMVVVEVVPSIYSSSFLLVMVKYVVGTSHHLLVPLAILAVRRDLRELVVAVYRKGGTTQNKSFDITYEELQRELGLGVDCA